MPQDRSSARTGRQVGIVLAALVALSLAPVGANASGTTFTVYAGRAPYNVSAWASATTNGDGIRKAIATVTAAGGGTVVLPRGELVVNHCLANAYCLPLASNVTVVGQGRTATTIKVADGENASSFAVFGQPYGTALSNVRLAHFGINGNRAHRAADPQMPGIRVGGPNKPITNLQLEDLYVRSNPGDAFQDLGDSNHVVIDRVVFRRNGRNGITMDPVAHTTSTDTIVTHAFLEGDQNAFDVEPNNATGSVDGLLVDGCTLTITRPQFTNYTLALSSGYYDGYAGFTRNVRVTNCAIFGATSLVGVQNLRMDHNRIPNISQKLSAISVRYRNDNVTIDSNIIDHTDFTSTKVDNAGILVQFCNGFQPLHIKISDNTITLHSPLQKGVAVGGAVFTTITGNTIVWDPASPAGISAKGIYVNTSAAMKTVTIADNQITNPRGFGIRVEAGQAMIVGALLIDRNLIRDNQRVYTVTDGINVSTAGPPARTGALAVGAIYRNGTDNVVVRR